MRATDWEATMTDVSYSDKLRWLADYLDAHPKIAEQTDGHYDYPSVYIYANTWDDFQELITHLDGYDKNGSNGSLSATHRQTVNIEGMTCTAFRVQVNVTGVCEARPKLDESGQPVTRKKSVWVETDEEETVMEYDCPKVWSV